MMRPLIRVTLYDATSENDRTLLEEDGEYFVSFGNRTGTYREFLRMILLDDRLYPDLVACDAAASFFALMKAVANRWNDRIRAEVPYAEPGLDRHRRESPRCDLPILDLTSSNDYAAELSHEIQGKPRR